WGGGALRYERVSPSFGYNWLIEGGMYDGRYLEKKGWINKIVPEDKWDENEILKTYLKKSHGQMLHLKSQYLENINLEKLYGSIDLESRRSANLWESEEHKSAVTAFLNKTKKRSV